MDGIRLEIRQAARRLVHSPMFSLAAVLTLAIAIGANASIFTVVQRVVINPLPYPDSDRLIELDHGAQGLNVTSGLGLTQGLYFHYLERSRTLESAALYQAFDQTVTGDGEPERIRVGIATPSLATVLRVRPALGRWFTDAEGLPGAPPVAVLSHAFWARRYASNARVIGQSIVLAGVPTEIIGVMPAGFDFPDPIYSRGKLTVAIWVAERISRAAGFGLWDYQGVARLRDGVTLEVARAELNGLIPDLAAAYPNDPRARGNVETKMSFTGRQLKEATVGAISRTLWILLAAVGLVLLIACANVANLFLVRSEARQREIAVRRALGAGRLAIARSFLTESLLLSIVGGTLGATLAWGAVRLLLRFGPANLPRLAEIRLDDRTLAFTALLSLATACAFGSIPLWRRADDIVSLQDSSRGNTASRGRHRARHLLMGSQIALALVLLMASGLMVRSFQNLRAIDPGFDPSSTMTFTIGLPEREYPTRAAVVATHHTILDNLSSLPGVSGVSASSCLPLVGACHGNTIRIEGRLYSEGTVPPLGLLRAVAGGYFETMRIPLLRGRTIGRGDVDRQEPIAVIDRSFATRYFPNEDPIGKRIASNLPPPRPGDAPKLIWLEIVGVVASTPVRTLAESSPLPLVYMPMSIARGPDIPVTRLIGPNVAIMSYVIRSATPPVALMPAVRHAIGTIDKNLALAQVRTLQDAIDAASAQMAFTMVLLVIAATIALALGVVGIYGVMSYIVTQRRAEIGVRLALGAEPGGVARAIVWQGGAVSIVGIVVGLGVAFGGGRLIQSLLYGVDARDPAIFVVVPLLLLGIALVASWLPARRASRLSPLDALRTE